MSRKIDALVAERVMGFKWHLCHELNPDGEMVYHLRSDAPPEWWKKPTEVEAPNLPQVSGVRRFIMLRVKPYSTSISAAWEVVEEMDKRHFGTHITRVQSLHGNKLFWSVDFDKPNDGADGHEHDTDSAPLAICLAALSAVGVAESEIQEAMQ